MPVTATCPTNTPTPALQIPALKPGEHYAGIILDKDGARGEHIILLPGDVERLTWEEAQTWAKEIHGALPTRREQLLLYTNLKEQFRVEWYWSCQRRTLASDYVWTQIFDYGHQSFDHQTSANSARAVRRVPLLLR